MQIEIGRAWANQDFHESNQHPNNPDKMVGKVGQAPVATSAQTGHGAGRHLRPSVLVPNGRGPEAHRSHEAEPPGGAPLRQAPQRHQLHAGFLPGERVRQDRAPPPPHPAVQVHVGARGRAVGGLRVELRSPVVQVQLVDVGVL